MTEEPPGPYVPDDPAAGGSPYVLVTVLADHDDPFRASELLRKAVPAHDPPEGWLWFYVRPQRRNRLQVAVLMQRRPDGAQPLLDILDSLGCGELTGQELALDEPVDPPRTPLLSRLLARKSRAIAPERLPIRRIVGQIVARSETPPDES